MLHALFYNLIDLEHIDRLVKNDPRKENVKGVKGYSPLLDLNTDFDIVHDVVVDEFHLIREGLAKNLIGRIVNCQAAQYQAVLRQFDEIYQDMRVFSELGWKTRSIKSNFAYFKG